MKTLQDYVVDDRLYVSDAGPEAVVGDQVKLFLDQQANPSFPEFIYGIIQHPIVRVNCDSSTSYDIEYNEADLLGAASLIRPGDVIDSLVVDGSSLLASQTVQIVPQTFTDPEKAQARVNIGAQPLDSDLTAYANAADAAARRALIGAGDLSSLIAALSYAPINKTVINVFNYPTISTPPPDNEIGTLRLFLGVDVGQELCWWNGTTWISVTTGQLPEAGL